MALPADKSLAECRGPDCKLVTTAVEGSVRPLVFRAYLVDGLCATCRSRAPQVDEGPGTLFDLPPAA